MTVLIDFKCVISGAQKPKKAHAGDAGYDLVATSAEKIGEGLYQYGTGIAIELPPGHCALLFPRSSVSNTGAHLANSIGLIDCNFHQEIKARFYADKAPYLIGDRVAQLVILPIPYVIFNEVIELSSSDRGGFGSSGK